jgi:hypothetical protein
VSLPSGRRSRWSGGLDAMRPTVCVELVSVAESARRVPNLLIPAGLMEERCCHAAYPVAYPTRLAVRGNAMCQLASTGSTWHLLPRGTGSLRARRRASRRASVRANRSAISVDSTNSPGHSTAAGGALDAAASPLGAGCQGDADGRSSAARVAGGSQRQCHAHASCPWFQLLAARGCIARTAPP